jgi:hypothetical protein
MTIATAEPIEVRISHADIADAKSMMVLEMRTLERLRRAGVPVKGVFAYSGLERGVITQYDDFETGDIVYRWKDD